jgi:hypothetical protein
MSPTASEAVPNRALDALEVRKLVERDFTKLLDGHSVLASPMSFGRVSWKISLVLTTEEHRMPIEIDSRPEARNLIAQNPGLAAVTSHPMPSQTDLTKTLTRELERHVTSPNAERLREGLPVPVDVKDKSTGATHVEHVQYAPDPSMPEQVEVTER